MKTEFLKALQKIMGSERVTVDQTNRHLYCRDMMTGSLLELKAGHQPHLPDIICWPENVREISQVLKTANRFRIPVIPFGGGSGVSGGTLPLHGGLIIDLKRMNRIEKIDGPFLKGIPHYRATAQSGILGEHLESQLNRKGFTLGHFPSSILCATLGGYLAARSAGQLSSRYGKIEDMVEAIEAVLPSGQIISFDGRIRDYKSALPRDLLVGTEGTLGIITRARLKIYPKAPAARYRGISFNQIPHALTAIREIMQSGLRPSVIRLYDPLDTLLLQFGYETGNRTFPKKIGKLLGPLKNNLFHLLIRNPLLPQKIFSLIPSDALLILGFEGDANLIEEQEKKAIEICNHQLAKDEGEGPGRHWLKHRYSVSFKMPDLIEKGCFVDTIEVAATWDKLLTLYHKVRATLEKYCLVLAHFSHAYPEGCSIYFTVVGQTASREKDYETYQTIWNRAMENCLEAGGTISHHHGIGLLKSKWMPRELGEGLKFFQAMKKKLDPNGIMNPGKMGL
ncbi:MAG: FAD-binding oxidoreductase [Deltaproteobacteria bacterium]|nr:FAD-binding oxidoreductase [Deltaproteobacteria bacterium]